MDKCVTFCTFLALDKWKGFAKSVEVYFLNLFFILLPEKGPQYDRINIGLLKMIEGVLTTCHKQIIIYS